MGFIQIIKMSAADFADVETAHEEWLRATEGQRTVTRDVICENRDKPGEYWVLVEFPSYEDAMRNNDLPATAKIAARMGELSGGQLEFFNLDVRRRD